MNGNKIIIAGGNGLIGSAIVGGFRGKGIEVVCADINPPGLWIDMAKSKTIEQMIEICRPFQGFVNCIYPIDFKTATQGWLDCTKMVADYFASNGGGSIVNFGSIYGMVGSQMDLYDGTNMDMLTEYAFIKGGIIAASRDIATKYAKFDVRCNVVSPGGVYDNQPPVFVERYKNRCPAGRMAVPEDLVELVWLLVNQGSEYISGVNIPVDGGWTAW